MCFRLQSIPHLPGYELHGFEGASTFSASPRFLQTRGVVCSVSLAQTYTRSARYFCPQGYCEGNKGNHFIRIHVAGAKEAHTIRRDFTCTFCAAVLEEDVSCRQIGEKRVVEFVEPEAFKSADIESGCVRYQALIAHLRDDLASEVQMGQCYHLIGQQVKKLLYFP